METTGEKIKNIRISLGFTQEKFAEEISKRENSSENTISKGTINNWEHNRNLPNKERLRIIADLGKTRVFYLLNEDKKESQKIKERIEIKNSVSSEENRLQNIFNERQKELGISVKEWADKTKVSPSTIYRYKKYGFDNITMEFFFNTAEVLNLSPRYLWHSINFLETMDEYVTYRKYRKYVMDKMDGLSSRQMFKLSEFLKEQIKD